MKNGTQKKASPAVSPTEQPDLRRQIEIRAYDIWEAEGHCQGKELEHWLQAESDLANERGLANVRSDRQQNRAASTFN